MSSFSLCVSQSVPCIHLGRELVLFLLWSDCRILVRSGIEGTAALENAPGDPRQIVGERHRELVIVHTSARLFQPGTEAEAGPVVRPYQNDMRRMNEKRAQVFASTLRDVTEDRLAAGRALTRHQTQPSGKVAPAIEGFTGADGRRHQIRRDEKASLPMSMPMT